MLKNRQSDKQTDEAEKNQPRFAMLCIKTCKGRQYNTDIHTFLQDW